MNFLRAFLFFIPLATQCMQQSPLKHHAQFIKDKQARDAAQLFGKIPYDLLKGIYEYVVFSKKSLEVSSNRKNLGLVCRYCAPLLYDVHLAKKIIRSLKNVHASPSLVGSCLVNHIEEPYWGKLRRAELLKTRGALLWISRQPEWSKALHCLRKEFYEMQKYHPGLPEFKDLRNFLVQVMGGLSLDDYYFQLGTEPPGLLYKKSWSVLLLNDLRLRDIIGLEKRIDAMRSVASDTSNTLNITSVFLSNNDLTELDLSVFAGLPHLRFLDLKNNRLRKMILSRPFEAKKMRTLDLSANQLTSLEIGLLDLMHAQRVFLSDNPIVAFRLESTQQKKPKKPYEITLSPTNLSKSQVDYLKKELKDKANITFKQ